MKAEFAEYYTPSEQEFAQLWDEARFVFDTNVLFNLYRYSREVCDDILHLMQSSGIKERVWLPHQFAYEYQKGRLDRIAEQRNSYEVIQRAVQSICKEHIRHSMIDVEKLFAPIIEKIKEHEGNHPDWEKSDSIRDALTELFEGKVGPPPTLEEVGTARTQGGERYKKGIPPGFRDKEKPEERRYGDLEAWFQIIKFAKDNKTSIILVTDEKKDDWWYIHPKLETIGPRPELIKEMKTEAGVGFYMYSSRNFTKYASKYLNRTVSPQTLEEIDVVTTEQIAGPTGGTASVVGVSVTDVAGSTSAASVWGTTDGNSGTIGSGQASI